MQIFKKYKKGIFEALFLIGLIIATFYLILRDENPVEIIAAIKDSNDWWLLLAVFFGLVFICGESVIMRYLFKALGQSVKLLRCIKYSFIGFFFSFVTPSATGGQPMQLLYMGKDKNKITESCLVLLIITIGYKSALIVMSALLFIFEGDFIAGNLDSVVYILIYGVIVNVLFILFLLTVIFNEALTEKIIIALTRFLHKIHIVKNEDECQERILTYMQSYKGGVAYLKSNKRVFFHVLWLSIVQRASLFLVTWCVYKSFGLHGISVIKIIALQTIISLSVDMLPFPGGVGVSEKSFEIMFDAIFGEELVIPGMILSRGISFYLLVVLTGIVTITVHTIMIIKEHRNININDIDTEKNKENNNINCNL